MKYLCGIFIVMALMLTYLSKNRGEIASDHGFPKMTFAIHNFIILASLVPVCMRLNLDLIKLYYKFQIGRDERIPGSTVQNSWVIEDLGNIQYMIMDKTGTLTKNQHALRKIAMEFAIYDANSFNRDFDRNQKLRGRETPKCRAKKARFVDYLPCSRFVPAGGSAEPQGCASHQAPNDYKACSPGGENHFTRARWFKFYCAQKIVKEIQGINPQIPRIRFLQF